MTRRIDPLAYKVRAYAERWDMLPAGGTILCAASGGRDSMALLHLLCGLASEGGLKVAAAHFNHRLRPTADRDEEFVRSWCREHAVPFTRGEGDVRGFAKENGLSIEDAARRLRYAFLEEAARELDAARIAAAHHREDNAETVLLHLLRGAGPRGLGGIPPVRGKIVRPLLEVGRGEIDAYIARHGLPYVEDESNRDPAYTRNRLRLEVLPLLEDAAPGAAERIAAAAGLVREEDGYLRREAERLLPAPEGDAMVLPAAVLRREDPVILRRVVRGMGERLGVQLTRSQTEAILALGSGGFLDLPGGFYAARKPHQLILQKQPPPLPPLALHLGEQTWGPWRVTVERRGEPIEETPRRVVLADRGGELSIAPWDGTGRLAVEAGGRPPGLRTLKRLFADAGIPTEKRFEHPVVLLDGQVVAAFGVAADLRYQARDGEACLAVTLA